MNDSIAILRDIFREQREREEELMFRNPSFAFWYNWLIFLLIIALFVSFFLWGIDSWTNCKATEMTNKAYAAWEEELAIQDETAKSSQEYVMDMEAQALARAFYGIRLFVEKYNYSEKDLETYARCIFNRSENGELIRVVAADGQFTGYSGSNPVLTEYYDLALRLVREWHEETVKPCDTAYIFAELTPDGIFLKKDLHADGYARRWQA